MAWLRAQRRSTSTPALAIAYMLIPIAVIAVFSFGETPKDKLNFSLNGGFTLEYWQHAFAIEELNDALRHLGPAGRPLDRDLDRDRDADGAGPGPPPSSSAAAPPTC